MGLKKDIRTGRTNSGRTNLVLDFEQNSASLGLVGRWDFEMDFLVHFFVPEFWSVTVNDIQTSLTVAGVTRFGEFWPIGRLTILSSFLKIKEVAQNLMLLFHGKSYVLILTKTGWVTSWAILLTNSSGHPACIPDRIELSQKCIHRSLFHYSDVRSGFIAGSSSFPETVTIR
jgi:hypothetical protein